MYGNFWWSIALQTVTEYHGGGKYLTRVRLRNRFVTTTIIFNLIGLKFVGRPPYFARRSLGFFVPYLLFLVFLWTRARLLSSHG